MACDSIYQSRNVTVTNTMVSINGTTYSIKNINSVFIKKEDVSRHWSTLIGCVVGGIVGYWFLGALKGPDTGVGLGIVALIVGVSLLMGIMKSVMGICAPIHYLIFSTSNGETQALHARNASDLFPVKRAIETAFS